MPEGEGVQDLILTGQNVLDRACYYSVKISRCL